MNLTNQKDKNTRWDTQKMKIFNEHSVKKSKIKLTTESELVSQATT